MATDRARYAVAFLQRLGWAPHQAAAIVGHLQQESGANLNPQSAGDRDRRGNPQSFGIAQWHKERATALRRYAASRGKPWTDLDVQLEYLNHELNTTERAAGNALRRAPDLHSAAVAFGGFERPQGYTPGAPHRMHGWNNRLNNARRLAGMSIGPGEAPASAGQIGPDQNTIRLAQQALRAQGYDVPLSGSLDSATTAALGEFRASPGGMAFAQAYGLPVRPQAQPAAYAPADQQAPAVQAVNAMAQGGQPQPRFRVAQVNAQGQTVQPDAVTPGPGVELIRPGSEYLDARPDRSAPGAYRVEAQPYRGPAPGTNPADMLQPAAASARPPVQMRMRPEVPPVLPALASRVENNDPTPVGWQNTFPVGPEENQRPETMTQRIAVGKQAGTHIPFSPYDPPPARLIAPEPSTRTAFNEENGGSEFWTVDPPGFAPGTYSRAPLPPLSADTKSIEYPAVANDVTMIAARQPQPPLQLPPPYINADYMRQQPVRSVTDLLSALPASPNMPPIPPRTVVDVTSGQTPVPRPHPIPMAQRGRSGRTPDGFQWRHIAQRGGPTILEVKTPKGRTWREPIGPPGGMGLMNEFASSAMPVRWV